MVRRWLTPPLFSLFVRESIDRSIGEVDGRSRADVYMTTDSDQKQAYDQYQESDHKASLSHELIAGAASYEAAKAYENHCDRNGMPAATPSPPCPPQSTVLPTCRLVSVPSPPPSCRSIYRLVESKS